MKVAKKIVGRRPNPKRIKKTCYNQVYTEKACKCEDKEALKAFFEELMERKMSQISAQYQELLEEVAQQKVLIQELLKERTDDSSIMREFPIKNKTDLGRINENIEVRGKKNYIKCMTQILQGSGVVKNLKNIITDELAMQYNINGVLGKDSLKGFTNFFDALIESIPTGIDAGSPENQLRQALQRQKKRLNGKILKILLL
ncbi:uncharacterized protein LOC126764604 [Bactrocera neohumeralis]|uniref:uncharacterized protein LOC126764604 n=1 Tax=Bactrocera neohumeralis TaxID=98809 RepID=UPI002166455B|nr:uncharacterized protein LOC126764604 [Bactrocera neohumeralis]